jgi:hypothetical protein
MVQTTPSWLFLRLPWDSERSASSDFTSLEQDKDCLGNIRRLTDHLDGFAAIKSPGLRQQSGLSSSPSRNSSWENNPNLFGLKIGWDVATAFVM